MLASLTRALVASAAAALILAGGALADPVNGNGDGSTVVEGVVVSVDTSTVTVHVLHGNARGQQLVGQDVTFAIPAGDNAAVGDGVHIQAAIADGAAQPYAANQLVDQTG
jgi:hypothetical protein